MARAVSGSETESGGEGTVSRMRGAAAKGRGAPFPAAKRVGAAPAMDISEA
jgi:hypothetical protein